MNNCVKILVLLVAVALLVPAVPLEAAKGEYEFVLYSMPSPREINWKSPASLARSAVFNNLTFYHVDHKHAIGHVFIGLTDGQNEILTGSVPDGKNSSNAMVMKQKYGLGILFANIEGRLEDTADLQKEIKDRYNTGRIGFIRFKLSEEMYRRLMSYLTEYRARGYGSIYNGLNRPREGLGAGCSAFGIAFLEVAGLLHPQWKQQWPVRVRVPLKLIGGPLTGNTVPITKVLTGKRWATEKEPHRLLELYEPYYIWSWIQKTWKAEKAEPTGNVQLDQRGKALGLIYDCRHCLVPDEPIFQGAAAER